MNFWNTFLRQKSSYFIHNFCSFFHLVKQVVVHWYHCSTFPTFCWFLHERKSKSYSRSHGMFTSSSVRNSWLPQNVRHDRHTVYHILLSISNLPLKYCTKLSLWEDLFWNLNELQHQCVLLHFFVLFFVCLILTLGVLLWSEVTQVFWASINIKMITRIDGSHWVQMPSISIEIRDSQDFTRLSSVFPHYIP